jgi:hypothetical protein
MPVLSLRLRALYLCNPVGTDAVNPIVSENVVGRTVE